MAYRVVNKIGHVRRLGIANLSSMLPLNERTQVAGALQGITGTLRKLPDLDAAVSDMDHFNATMGADGAEFLKLWNEASAICTKVKALYDRLVFQDPGEWYADAAEIQAMVAWTAKVERMYALYAAHFPKPPESTAVPQGTPTCQEPLSTTPSTPGGAAGGGAPAPGSAAPPEGGGSPPTSPATPIPSAPLGVGTTPLLVGGGVLAALGLLIWGLS
jgi:hypothetical protein